MVATLLVFAVRRNDGCLSRQGQLADFAAYAANVDESHPPPLFLYQKRYTPLAMIYTVGNVVVIVKEWSLWKTKT